MSSYCGKNCGECPFRSETGCGGCGEYIGKRIWEKCEIALCCRRKSHTTCATCTECKHCRLLDEKDQMPVSALEKEKKLSAKKAGLAIRASFLGKWLWLLFWLIIPDSIASIMISDPIIKAFPGLYWPGQILSICCDGAYGLILLAMSKKISEYKAPGLCYIVIAGVTLIINVLFPGSESFNILMLPLVIAGLFGTYAEFSAHAYALVEINSQLSDKWNNLWEWYIKCLFLILGGVAVVFIFASLGLFILLAGSVLVVGISIFKLIYIYRSAKACSIYAKDRAQDALQ